ncbi:hypothetical protein WPS_19440 [Vulcanimicrobium alpinum]|uniref:Glycosyltransferase RgtA/B/C/D-like domain-containing protein n=1 Tax=Vulcanimicrobium alpinum TaxID=3016050 RepID=A0AAN1XYH9_UNVUL|nr:glycosyltransferase family 39 protein [Vulcanimicrobium alpinum]BDE06668.1 hypothetical protein WPS_19440 [Vulcanimicrobium alpinum]
MRAEAAPHTTAMEHVRGSAAVLATLAGLVLAALAVRLIALAWLGSPLIDMDGANFARTAENLAHGYGYIGIRGTPNSVHVSIFPAIVAALVWIGISAERAGIIVSLVAGSLLVVPVYAIASRLAGTRAAMVAAGIVAINPIAVATSVTPLADSLAFTLAVTGLHAFLRSRENPRWALAAGAWFGLAYCTRSETIVYAFVALCAVMLAVRTQRGSALRRAAALAVAFAVFAVPYAVVISRATGHARIDTKSAVNYALAERIAQGMSYDEAADGLGPGLREDGAELGAGFYATHPGIGDPPLRARLALAVRGFRSQVARIGRALLSFNFGTPLFAAFALAGLVRGLRRPGVRGVYGIVGAIASLDLCGLLTLQHLWPRYVAPFVPLFAILAAEPLDALVARFSERTTPGIRRGAVVLGLIVVTAYLGLSAHRLSAETVDATLARRAAAWLDADAPGPKLIMAVGNEVAFYAHGDWMPLPYANSAETLAYVRGKRPTYLLLEGSRTAARPYLSAWLRDGVPDASAHFVKDFGSGADRLAIYAWNANAASAVAPPARIPEPPADDAVVRASRVLWSAPPGSLPTSATHDSVDVLTAHNDVGRLGWNDRERSLTTANVASRAFGKRLELPIDGQSYGQPLIVTGVDVPGLGRRTLLIAATERDSVYAFDADSGAKLWVHTFTGCCGAAPAPLQMLTDTPCESVKPVVGVSSVPVVDRRTGTLYVVAKTMTRRGKDVTFHSTLHALSLATGADRLRPAEIRGRASVSLRGVFAPDHAFRHSVRRLLPGGGTATFDPRAQYNRPGLLLANGLLYIGFGSHCDVQSSHGWVFAYRAADLAQVGSFATTRDWNDENLGSVWQAGFGITGDRSGDVYFLTGNGPFNADEGGRNFGNSLMKLTPDLGRVLDYFTPYTQRELQENDADFGGGGMIALPDGTGPHAHLGVVSSKVRAIFLIDRDRLGRYVPRGPDRVLQTIGDNHDDTHWCIGTCGGPAYYAGPAGEYVFNVWALDALRAYRLDRQRERPKLVEVAHSPNVFPGSGGSIPSVSSNGRLPGTGIVWSLTRPNIRDVATKPIELYAYDASDVSHVLYHGDVSLWPNKVGHPFLTPTIANGRVYVGGDHSISVFGLR